MIAGATIETLSSRMAQRLSWVGMQVWGPLPFLQFDGLAGLRLPPDSQAGYAFASPAGASVRELSSARSDDDPFAAMAAQVQEFVRFQDEIKRTQKQAMRWALAADLVVGASVAGLATMNRQNQYILIVACIAVIQLVLSIIGFSLLWYTFEKVVAEQLRHHKVASSIIWKLRKQTLSYTFKILLFAYPIRIAEFFVFVAGFLVLYSYSADDTANYLGPVERFAHWATNFISYFFYGNDNLTPHQRLGAAILKFFVTTFGGGLIQIFLPTRFG